MKHAALLNVLLVFAWFAVGLPVTPAMEAPAPQAVLDATTAQPSTCATQAAGFPFQPTYCGDPCSPNGSTSGCIDTSSSPWRRLICYCSNGTLVC